MRFMPTGVAHPAVSRSQIMHDQAEAKCRPDERFVMAPANGQTGQEVTSEPEALSAPHRGRPNRSRSAATGGIAETRGIPLPPRFSGKDRQALVNRECGIHLPNARMARLTTCQNVKIHRMRRL